ncbi:hypothetical protein BRADI_2g59096v3 [Brachypodium distachyon]|uniref:Uncharacterized protein n=1 Tax=Brachypodium distachyon TaxID=15368 RepID=A0A2K2DGT5_BRADI|nr:hypothetical protein BRADI_2g59096v3 [Brachypodium distachyon]PNT73490.1 hypothetical protein BRADI_2g59096v3 [Brachypodium distachyon]PNT73491.1 hypothetical protein BRADI_2g59096v3 [Brachypodium distachyon]
MQAASFSFNSSKILLQPPCEAPLWVQGLAGMEDGRPRRIYPFQETAAHDRGESLFSEAQVCPRYLAQVAKNSTCALCVRVHKGPSCNYVFFLGPSRCYLWL